MSTCTVINQNTKEPKLYFKSDRGTIHETLPEVLQNSDNSYQVGFKDSTLDFRSRATMPIYSEDTRQGLIQLFIKNEYLKPEHLGNDTYEAQDIMAANMIEETMILTDLNGYERNGNKFTFGDFKINPDTIENPDVEYAVRANDALYQIKTRDTSKPVKYTDEQATSMILDILNQLGFSVEFVNKLQERVGAEVSGMVDFTNRIVKVAQGEDTLDNLFEEYAHVLVEALDQDMVTRMLRTIHTTPEYAEHAEVYRQIYASQITDPVALEQAVRREVLGKMLAVSLQQQFDPSTRTQSDMNFFNGLINMLREFFNKLVQKINPSIQAQIDDLAQDVANKMYNKSLSEYLNSDMDPALHIMYAARIVSPDEMRKIYEELKMTGKSSPTTELETEVYHSMAGAVAGAASTLELIKKLPDGQSTTQDIDNNVERLRMNRDYVNMIANYVEVSNNIENQMNLFKTRNPDATAEQILNERARLTNFKDSILQKKERYNILMSDIDGMTKNNEADIENIVTVMERELNPDVTDEEIQERIHGSAAYAAASLQQDTWWFWEKFGHVAKSSNLFLALAGAISNKAQNESTVALEKDLKLVQVLEKYKDKLKNFVKSGRLVTEVNQQKIEEARVAYIKSILDQVFPDEYSDKSLEDFRKAYAVTRKIPELEQSKTESYFKYHYLYKLGLPEQDWVDEAEKTKQKGFIDIINQVVGDQEPWLQEFTKDLILSSEYRPIDHTLRKEKASPITVSGDLKPGLEMITYGEFQNNPTKYPNPENLVSTNPNLFFTGNVAEANKPKQDDIVYYYSEQKAANSGTDKSGLIAFHYMKSDRIRKYNETSNIKVGDKTVREILLENFREEYQEYKRILTMDGITDQDARNKLLREWIHDKILAENTEEYWDEFQKNKPGIDFDLFFRTETDRAAIEKMEELRKDYVKLSARKSNILRKFKSRTDYKEIDALLMTPEDKQQVKDIENEIAAKRREILVLFKEADLEERLYATVGDNTISLNQSGRNEVLQFTGKSLEESSLAELERFFLSNDNSTISNHIYQKQKAKAQIDINDPSLEEARDTAKKLGFGDDVEGVMKAFLIRTAQSWHKRYDSTETYDIFLRDLYADQIPVETMLDEYVTGNHKTIRYRSLDGRDVNVSTMTFSPSFRYINPFQPNPRLLLQEYQMAETPAEKMDIIRKLTGGVNISDEYKEDLSWITGENQEIYLAMWDVQATRLLKDFGPNSDRKLTRHYVSIMPQVRRTSFERVHKMMQDTSKDRKVNWANMKDWMKETYMFREDDYEESYQDRTVPMYGYFEIPDDERSEDLLHAMAWGLRNANRRHVRLKYLRYMLSALKGIEAQNFGKVDAKNTSYRKMLQDHIDHVYYGRTTSFNHRFIIPLSKAGLGEDITVDMAKVADAVRILSVKAALMFSPVTAMTNFIGGLYQNAQMAIVGHDIYGKSNMRALKINMSTLHGAVQDIGEYEVTSKTSKIYYSFGYKDREERFRDARYPKAFRVLDGLGFSMMAATNYPLEMQTMLSKLTEYRLIDGKFVDWKTFKKLQNVSNPGIKTSEIAKLFDSAEKLSAYDMLDDATGDFSMEKLQQAGYTGDIDSDKSRMMSAIRDITERTTMEIKDINEAGGLRDPRLSFFISMKKWMVISTSSAFARARYDYMSNSEEKGLFQSLGDIGSMALKHRKSVKEIGENWDNISAIDKVNLRRGLTAGSMIFGALALATLLKGMADDDDEKDNYALQFGTYMALRSLNEMSSANILLPNTYFETISSPIMALGTVTSSIKLLNLGDIGETVESGKYAGQDKYVSNIMKATWLKNLYTVSSADAIKQTRTSYLHFNTNDSLYHVFSLIPSHKEE